MAASPYRWWRQTSLVDPTDEPHMSADFLTFDRLST
jgi:hypothetical protein